MSENIFDSTENSNNLFLDNISKYISFWPFFLISIIISFISAKIYLKYSTSIYSTTAKIEILDDAMDKDMTLPTSMTIFNRSTINLENEIQIISSFRLMKQVVQETKANITYYTLGTIKTQQNHKDDWLSNVKYELNYTDDIDQLNNSFLFDFDENGINITRFLEDQLVKTYYIDGYDTSLFVNDLPFNLKIVDKDISDLISNDYQLVIQPISRAVNSLKSKINLNTVGEESDILQITYLHPNPKIARETLNTLIDKFDNDGIIDRQLVFKRTIDFVDDRFTILKNELNEIELIKENFKRSNNLSDLQSDLSVSSSQIINYESQSFNANTQLELSNLILESIEVDKFDFIPVNLGLDNSLISDLINNFNLLISNRNKYISSTGSNNLITQNIENEILITTNNIIESIKNYQEQLNVSIKNIDAMKKEYNNKFEKLPENEMLLRSIEREQEIKEALFLLLLQKKEEASINFAITKPSIKIIDNAITKVNPISPNRKMINLASLAIGFLIPFIFLYLWFLFDNKIHSKEDIKKLLKEIPVLGEIPYLKDIEDNLVINSSTTRSILKESFRMLATNLDFVNMDKDERTSTVILSTSSIKGEGKTFVAFNIAHILKNDSNKVLLIGADLRNPRIHRKIGVKKTEIGLSEYITNKNIDWRDHLLKFSLNNEDSIDILLSGAIPPNPSDLIKSNHFEKLINEAKSDYEFIIIDSAPCLLVSETLLITKHVDLTLYSVRSNFSNTKLIDFIDELHSSKKLKNMNIVLNGVGNSRAYGYKYNYRYGYQYNYNYGYGYGYKEEKD